jgi:hypothetical protein
MAKSQAVTRASEEIPEFNKFQSSPEYEETLKQYPLIKSSIDIAESNPHMANDLVQLYKMAYEIASSKTLSKLVQERQQTPPAAPTTVRPTVTSTPVAPGTVQAAPPSLKTPEGRKSIIAAFEEKGLADLPM